MNATKSARELIDQLKRASAAVEFMPVEWE
jgi:hypothetical protein